MSFIETEIKKPTYSENEYTALDLSRGEVITPLKRLEGMEPDAWEKFTLELSEYLSKDYEKMTQCGGSGDLGRDILAYNKDGKWENYQCKHYSNRLNVAQAITEIGKVIYYSYMQEYTLPSRYYFVTPKGSSSDLIKLFQDVTKIKEELFLRWDKSCKNSIKTKEIIELTDDLKKFIETKVEFKIFEEIPPLKLIQLHRNTKYHSITFGNYHKKRPLVQKAPEEIKDDEYEYIKEFLKALSEYKKYQVTSINISSDSTLKKEFNSVRNNFYSAAALESFSRDYLPPSSFVDLKEQSYEAISPTIKQKHENGYDKFLKTSDSAITAPYDSHPLNPFIKIQDKKGLCHHLVNDGEFVWSENNEK